MLILFSVNRNLYLSPDNQDFHIDTISLFVWGASALSQKCGAPDCAQTSFQDAEGRERRGPPPPLRFLSNILACEAGVGQDPTSLMVAA